MIKKILSLIIISVTIPLFADEFVDRIQLITFITACAGQYSAIQAGYDSNKVIGNYYTPEMYADGFKSMSGNRTSTQLFYGICTDYAFAEWNYINRYKTSLMNIGMKEDGFFIVDVNKEKPNIIQLFRPVIDDGTESNYVLNGIEMVKVSEIQAQPHENVTNHAWIWIQKNNDEWYWMDPTFSDNTGYIHFGQVINGKEIYLESNPKYAINTQKNSQETEEKRTYSEYNKKQNDFDYYTDLLKSHKTKLPTSYSYYDFQENRDGLFISVSNFFNNNGLTVPQNYQIDLLFAINYSDNFYWGTNIEYSTKTFDAQIFNQLAVNAVLGVAFTFDFLQFYIDGNIGLYNSNTNLTPKEGISNISEYLKYSDYGIKTKGRIGISLIGELFSIGIFYEYNYYFNEPRILRNSNNQILAHSVIGCNAGILF